MDRRKEELKLDPSQTENMKNMGDLLRIKRKEMNLSLKEAENATSIRIVYLQALEDGEMHKLISPIYAQGFFKQYASFLGIDGEQVVRENPGVFHRPAVQEFDYGIGTLEGRGNPGSGVKWFPNALWILAFLAMAFVAWYFARLLGVIG